MWVRRVRTFFLCYARKRERNNLLYSYKIIWLKLKANRTYPLFTKEIRNNFTNNLHLPKFAIFVSVSHVTVYKFDLDEGLTGCYVTAR